MEDWFLWFFTCFQVEIRSLFSPGNCDIETLIGSWKWVNIMPFAFCVLKKATGFHPLFVINLDFLFLFWTRNLWLTEELPACSGMPRQDWNDVSSTSTAIAGTLDQVWAKCSFPVFWFQCPLVQGSSEECWMLPSDIIWRVTFCLPLLYMDRRN